MDTKKKRLFGTSGIRRKAAELSDDFAYDLGRALGTYTKDKSVAVGRDPRKSSPRLEYNLVRGIISTGKDAVLLGIVPTPTVGIAAMDHGTAVMITASHNPPEYNGFKFWDKKGAFRPDQERALEGIFYCGEYLKAKTEGNIGEAAYLDKHKQLILSNVGKVKRKVKIFLDCANGAGATLTPHLLEEMGCEVVAINTETEGVFAHGLEPREENLREVSKTMKESGAEVGIVHDGDADRTAALDREGRLIDWDSFLSALAYGKKKVVTTVDASMRIEDVCGEVIRTPVGDVAVANAIIKYGADFGGEPSGSYIFPEVDLFPDGPLTAAVVAKMVSEDRFYKILSEIKTYPTERVKIPCAEDKKQKTMKHLLENIKTTAKVDNTDGIRITYDDGWILVRPSGTEAYMRITAEAKTKEALERIVSEGRKWIDAAMKQA